MPAIELSAAFARLYNAAYRKLIARLSTLAPAEQASLRSAMQREIERTVAVLDKLSEDYIPQMLETAYRAAEKKVNQMLPGGNIASAYNSHKLRLLAENTLDELVTANHRFGRLAMDKIREIGVTRVSLGLAGERDTRRAITRLLVNRFESEGMELVQISSHRSMDLRSYAELVARTTTREADNLATIETTTRLGYDLVQFTRTQTCCGVCAAVMGRIFSVSGQDTRFPALSEVAGFREGFRTIHPHCKHNLVPVVWDLLTPEEQMAALAQTHEPLDRDTRTKDQIDTYNRRQAQRRQLWQDRRQWERYKGVLGSQCPKSFSAFRRAKYSDGKADALSHTYRHILIQRKKIGPSAANWTADDEKAILDYKTAQSYVINEMLRRGKPLTESDRAFARSLDRALSQLPDYEGTVYRSVDKTVMKDQDVFNNYHQSGVTVLYSAYTSTSKEVYDPSFQYQFVIQSHHGKDLSPITQMEGEVLFPRNTRFQIKQRIQHEIQMEEVK